MKFWRLLITIFDLQITIAKIPRETLTTFLLHKNDSLLKAWCTCGIKCSIYNLTKIEVTYSPVLSTAIACTGPLWHSTFTSGSLVLGAQSVTVPKNHAIK